MKICPKCKSILFGKLKSCKCGYDFAIAESNAAPEVRIGGLHKATDFAELLSLGNYIQGSGRVIVVAGFLATIILPFIETGAGDSKMEWAGVWIGSGIAISGILIVALGQLISIQVINARSLLDIKQLLGKLRD